MDVLRVPWDGIAKEVKAPYNGPWEEECRHWRLVDAEGQDVVSYGQCSIRLFPGDEVTFTIDVGQIDYKVTLSRSRAPRVRYGDILGTPCAYTGKSELRGTRSDLEARVASVPGIVDFKIESEPGHVTVRVREVTAEFASRRHAVYTALQIALEAGVPAGISPHIFDNTPEHVLQVIASRVRGGQPAALAFQDIAELCQRADLTLTQFISADGSPALGLRRSDKYWSLKLA
jgi:hypothetical protein